MKSEKRRDGCPQQSGDTQEEQSARPNQLVAHVAEHAVALTPHPGDVWQVDETVLAADPSRRWPRVDEEEGGDAEMTDLLTQASIHAVLTKAFLMSLPTGRHLASNTFRLSGSGRLEPVFYEPVFPPAEREEQWARVKERGVNGRRCHVWDREAAAQCERLLRPRSRKPTPVARQRKP